MNEYNFKELLFQALKTKKQADIDRLGKWLDTYDPTSYNGEHYSYRDENNEYIITPVWKEVSEGEWEIEKYELDVYGG